VLRQTMQKSVRLRPLAGKQKGEHQAAT